MRAKLITISAAIFFIAFLVSCEKDNAGPKIGFSLKSVNGTDFTLNDNVVFKFEFTPKTEQADTLFVIRRFYTCSFIPNPDTLKAEFPEFPNNGKAELEYAFTIGQGGFFNDMCYNGTSVRRTDSLNYVFWVKDKDGNVSDTIVSPKIILRRP